MIEKAIIFDAGTLITLAMNGLFEEIRELKKIFNGKFIITREVKKEMIDKPLTIKRFELEALRLNQLFNEKILELPSSLNVLDSEISKKADNILKIANSTFKAKGKNIHIIDLGEATCFALSRILTEKGIKNVVAIDERTMRMLCEKPENLEKLLQKKLRVKIESNKRNFEFFKGFKIIRSSELVYVAYKKGIIKLKGPKVLDALLYAVKFKGCSISEEEIKEIENL